jgi:hypothetical protein
LFAEILALTAFTLPADPVGAQTGRRVAPNGNEAYPRIRVGLLGELADDDRAFDSGILGNFPGRCLDCPADDLARDRLVVVFRLEPCQNPARIKERHAAGGAVCLPPGPGGTNGPHPDNHRAGSPFWRRLRVFALRLPRRDQHWRGSADHPDSISVARPWEVLN